MGEYSPSSPGGGGNTPVVGTDADNAANSTTKLPTIPARANAAAPSWTEGREVPLSVDLSGSLRASMAANQSVNVAQIAGSATTTLAAGEQKVATEGLAASGAAKSGNPLQVGGVFNTTQPTVTTGQAVEAQATARGALIVASGVDALNVTPAANSAVNVAQIAGSSTVTAAAGVQKIGITGNTGAAMDATGQNAASPANELLVAGQFNTTPTTITSGNVSPLQVNSKGELLSQLTDGTTNVAVIAGTTALKTDQSSIAGTATVTGGVAGLLAVGGNVASGVADAGNPLKIGGVALTTTSIPTAVATGQRVNQWYDLVGAQVVRAGFRNTYTVNYRLTSRPYALSNAFGAAGTKQYATIYHTGASTKTVRILSVLVTFKSSSASITLAADFRRLSLTTAPATGNPAETPLALNPGVAAAEAATLSLPTTAGSETDANQGFMVQEYAVTSSTSPFTMLNLDFQKLSESQVPTMRSGNAEGWAVILDASAAATITAFAQIVFTEE